VRVSTDQHVYVSRSLQINIATYPLTRYFPLIGDEIVDGEGLNYPGYILLITCITVYSLLFEKAVQSTLFTSFFARRRHSLFDKDVPEIINQSNTNVIEAIDSKKRSE
jgi:hypothetical protein